MYGVFIIANGEIGGDRGFKLGEWNHEMDKCFKCYL